jgi:Mce-associated membrane protein
MTNTPGPTWYDVLGVSRDADPAEIRAAWRAATDKFEPGSGSGQFRMFNEAAEVLLDPARRAAYDESLSASGQPEMAPEDVQPVTADAPPPPPTPAPEPKDKKKGPKKDKVRRPRTPDEPASRGAVVAAAVLAVLTLVALGLVVVFGLQVRSDAKVADAREQAPAAAERAAKALFSYDYRHLPADRDRAANYVTDSFGKQYLKNFTQLEKQKDGSPGLAVQSKTVVTANVAGSGVVDAEDGVARVLVYVNQTSQKPGAKPQIFQNRVSMTMRQDGDRWLVDDVKSY